MRSLSVRIKAFCIAGIISFCSTIAPAYALTTSFAGLPSINAIIQGTIGTFVDTSTGVTITRSAVAIAEGVSIPFTVAEAATFGEVAAGGVAAGLAVPAGFAAGVVIAAALAYGWYKCTQSPAGWCKTTTSTSVPTSTGWTESLYGYGPGDKEGVVRQACSRHGQTTYRVDPNQPSISTPYRGTAAKPPNGYNDASAFYQCTTITASGTTVNANVEVDHQIFIGDPITTGAPAPQSTDPVHSPEAQSLTQRAMAENKIRASDLASAAQSDGHPVDDPKVNPKLPTTVTASPTSAPPTVKVDTAPDGTKTTTTCSGTASLGTSSDDNSIAVVTKAASTNCTTVAVSPDGTTKTSSTNTSEAPKAATGPVECGSPGKPKCAIDETGTMTSDEVKTTTDEGQKNNTDLNDQKTATITNITPSSIGIFDWFPRIQTAECVNPQIPTPITGTMRTFEMCAPVSILSKFLSGVMAFFALIGSVRNVQEALKA